MKGLALTALLIAASAYGQTVSQVNDALGAIKAHDKLLEVSFGNLRGMTIGQEADVLNSITGMVTLFRVSDGTVIAVGNILPHMRDPEDAKHVRIQLQHSLDAAVQIADVAVNGMNGYMTLLKGPAALAETTKARDEMIAIREQLRSLKT
jgi:hypothetical protein